MGGSPIEGVKSNLNYYIHDSKSAVCHGDKCGERVARGNNRVWNISSQEPENWNLCDCASIMLPLYMVCQLRYRNAKSTPPSFCLTGSGAMVCREAWPIEVAQNIVPEMTWHFVCPEKFEGGDGVRKV